MILLVYTTSSWPLEILQLGRWEDVNWVVQGFGISKALMFRRMACPDLLSLSASPKASFPKMSWAPGMASSPEQMESFFRSLSQSQHATSHHCQGLLLWTWSFHLRWTQDAQILTQFWNTIFCNQWPCLTKRSFPYAFLFWGFFSSPYWKKPFHNFSNLVSFLLAIWKSSCWE